MKHTPRPGYLDIRQPRQALLTFHKDMAQGYRKSITDQRDFEANEAWVRGQPFDPAQWERECLAEAKWENGSAVAVWRDMMAFHERCIEEITRG